MRRFFLAYPPSAISETPPRNLDLSELAQIFTLPCVHLRSFAVYQGRSRSKFYEAESLRGGWSVRRLDRRISSQLYERTALSKNKAAMLVKGRRRRAWVAFSEGVADFPGQP